MVVDPINVLYSVIIEQANSVDSALDEWDPVKTDYALEDEVKVAADRKKYKLAAQSVDAGVVPSENPDIWMASVLTEYAPFDYNNEAAGEFDGDFICVIPDAYGIDTLFFQDFDGDSITAELLDVNDEVIDTFTTDIYEWEIENFSSYLFPKDAVLNFKEQFDFMYINLYKIRITISGATTKCRYIVPGFKDDLGLTMRKGIGYSQNNFYTSERDGWGNLIDKPLRMIEDATIPVINENALINKHTNKTARLFGSSKLYIADDRDKKIADFPFVNLFGQLISNNVTPGGHASTTILKLKGK